MMAEAINRVVICGAAGRDFHDFNVVYRAVLPHAWWRSRRPRSRRSPGVVTLLSWPAGRALARLAVRRFRLVIVHGNGPQVGRLLQADRDPRLGNPDIHVAQTVVG